MSFPKYPKYKDSGASQPTTIPAHWQETCVKRFSTLQRGHDLTDSERTDGPYPVVTSGGINGTHGSFVAHGPGVVTGRYGSTGRLFYIEEDFWPHNTSLYVCNFNGNLPRFAWYSLHTIDFATHSAKTAVPGIDRNDIHVLWVAVPPPEEQAAIATFLDRETAKIDVLIAEQQRLIELLQEKRQAVISHAVTKGLNPDALMKDSGIDWLGEIPKHWGVTPLKYVARFTSGGTPSKSVADYWNGDVPWASSKDLKSETLSDTCDHITRRALDEGAAVLVPAGSVLVVVRGMILLHTFPVVQTLVPMAINQDVKAVAPTNGVAAVYLPWLLRGSATETFGRIDEAAHGTKVLRMESWTSIALPIPPRPEQAAIAAFLDRETANIDALIAEQRRAISLLQERRSALISAAVTGQIDVRGLAGSEAA